MFKIPDRPDNAVDVPASPRRGNRTTTVESLLVMLSLRPMSGYQMRLAIQRTIGNFWQESFGQIYPALRRMEAEGLIASSGAAEKGNGSGRVYSLTDAGRERLREWLELPCDRQVMRDELLLKLFAGSKAPRGSLEKHVRAYRDLVAEDLRRYREVERRLPEAQRGNPELPYIMMTLRQGLLKAEALLRWSEQTIGELRELEDRTVEAPLARARNTGRGLCTEQSRSREVAMAADPLWMRALLATHVAAGAAAFVLAPVALATAKGGKQHKRWGMVYFWAMAVVAGTALPMALFRPIFFLALISLLAFYLVFSGYRVLRLKSLANGGSAAPVDWITAGLVLCVGVSLVGFGWFDPHALHVSRPMGYVAIVLGLVTTRLGLADLRMYWRKPKEKMFWWYSHLGKFIGSYIAAWTAFSTVTLPHIFPHAGIVLWLWPVTVGVPAIILTTAYYKRKFTPRRPAAAAAAA